MKKTIIYIASLLFIIALNACQEEYVVENTSTVEMSGEWWGVHLVEGEDIYGVGMVRLATYNTAADNAEYMWLTDNGNFWDYKVKVPINYDNLTFEGEGLTNAVDGYDISINVMNGKVMKDAAHSNSGVVVDSIYYEIEFEDDPGTIYQVKGIGHTGFPEDDY
jgi:hypothetical protein